MIKYGYLKSVRDDFTNLESRIENKMKEVGFSLVSRLDIREKFKKKLNMEYKNYVILGFCSPANAYKAIELEENVGLMLPCNIILYESGDSINLAVIKPTVAMSSIDNPKLSELALHIEKELISVIKNL